MLDMDSKIIELTEKNVCKICENQYAKYNCPRCNILYCTVVCYQSEKHLECSENFYQKCVLEELALKEDDGVSKAKMEDIIKRFNEEHDNQIDMTVDSDDEENVPELSERLADIDLDDATKVWEQLTADERQEFESLLASGDVGKLVPIWEPWWNCKVGNELVQEVEDVDVKEHFKKCPKIHTISRLDEISGTAPSYCVKYNMFNVIGAYSCVVRYFNGDHFNFSKEAVYLIFNLSKNVHSNTNFESTSLALESVHQQALMNDWIKTDEDIKDTLYSDVKNIVQGPNKHKRHLYIYCALSELMDLLVESKKPTAVNNENEFSKRFRENELPRDKYIPNKKINITVKKVHYYLCYTNTYKPEFD